MDVFHNSPALSIHQTNNLMNFFVKNNIPIINIYAEYIHFIELLTPLNCNEKEKLNKLLTYGPNLKKQKLNGKLILVTPRLGTISSWSSKATEIANKCNFKQIKRIERGIAYYVQTKLLTKTQWNIVIEQLYDKMIENIFFSFSDVNKLFISKNPLPIKIIDILKNSRLALEIANKEMGLALTNHEINHLLKIFLKLKRNPTDVELYSFAQINSEHCRHKIFNANLIINGETKNKSLFKMIKNTFKKTPDYVLSAYKDNSAVIKGFFINHFFPDLNNIYKIHKENSNILIKAETHNHPTGISPFAGAATGSGGEIRDEGSTGRGSKPKASLVGFSVSNLRIPGFEQPWEEDFSKPNRIASALDIIIKGSLGSSSYNNEFGRPTLVGYFRTYEEKINIYNKEELYGYNKPIMLVGGFGVIRSNQIKKENLIVGTKLIILGGASMNIGLGGSSASSITSGQLDINLDFASVQRDNAEMERRCQEVINKCWQLGNNNPILFIHDIGAGGLSNAVLELLNEAKLGGNFELRSILNSEQNMSPLEIWCNESQERYLLAITKNQLNLFSSICKRENTPFMIIGETIKQRNLILNDSFFKNQPINLPINILINKTHKTFFNIKTFKKKLQPLNKNIIHLNEAIKRVLRLPSVAEKTFLITISDRSISGMVSRDQMIGPWQVPVADCAVTTASFDSYYGESMSIGEKPIISLINSSSSARMAVGEALTNIVCSYVKDLKHIKLSANWMAAANHLGENTGLYEAVKTISEDLCPKLGLTIPIGKDSMSMKTCWKNNGSEYVMISPLSLIISAFGLVEDVRLTVTPELKCNIDNILILIDLGKNNNSLGGSALAQVYRQLGNNTPDVRDSKLLSNFFKTIQKLIFEQKLLAYHDRSDGGLFVTLIEMTFAGHCGINIDISSFNNDVISILFNEELGAVIQIRAEDKKYIDKCISEAGLNNYSHYLGNAIDNNTITISNNDNIIYKKPRKILRQWWSETTWQIQRIRDNKLCADQEYESKQDDSDPGLNSYLMFDINDDISAPYILSGIRPKVAILREQGINSHTEMAAAFYYAGFDAIDVHMNDLLYNNLSLNQFNVLVACGGFSYGDVLGAGEGWAKSILFDNRIRDKFKTFFNRKDTLSLGVCNGCQMMSNLHELIPGAEYWPRFVQNLSGRFESRFVLVEITKNPSIFLDGMNGSQIPITVSHAEGKIETHSDTQLKNIENNNLVAMRFINNYGKITEQYPANPNGSVNGITSITSIDGRATIMMPHPERVFRTINNSWYPKNWGENSPWMRIFRNARKQLG